MKYIESKTLITKTKNSEYWFSADYNMNLYKGCCHGCIYCDSRSNCYNIENFDEVKIKKDALKILERELISKRKKGVISIGAMSDTYNPFEIEHELTRNALKLINKYGFGVSIDTKSDLILRDIDILKEINKHSPVIIKVTITTEDDVLSKTIEPRVVESSKRFEAIKKLNEAGIFAGILLTPTLPYITDDRENILSIVKKSSSSQSRFIYAMFGVTLRENQRDYYYKMLDEKFKGLKEIYIKEFGNSYLCNSKNSNELYKLFSEECKKHNILYKMRDIIKEYKYERKNNEQISIF